jgi:S-layer homology domain
MKNRAFFNWLIIFLGVVAATGLVLTPVMAQNAGEPEEFSADQIVTEGDFGPDVETGDSFGEGYQYTYIPAADFTPYNSSTTYDYWGSGYRYLTAGTWMDAGIRLPSGAYLSVARLDYYDNDGARSPGLYLLQFDNPSSSFELCSITAPPGTPGYTNTATGCTSINHTIRNGNTTYVARVVLSAAAGSNIMFKGVRLYWKRQIRTGLSHPFNDIGGLSTEFQHSIAALYQSGITTGTTPTTYSPFSPVNRGQMATFLARALGLHWPH